MAFYIPTPSHSCAIDSHSFPYGPILEQLRRCGINYNFGLGKTQAEICHWG